MTKEEERRILDAFKEAYIYFPEGEIIHTDAPDFIINTSKYTVGIEVTEIFQDSFLKSSKFKQIQAYHTKTALGLIDKLQVKVHFPFSLHMNYDDRYIEEGTSGEIVEKCFEICLPHIIDLKDGKLFHIDNPLILPRQVKRITISRFDKLSKSYYGHNEGGAVADLQEIHIERIIRDKESKLPKYITCDEQWLLIREGNYYAGSFSEVTLKTPIDSQFKKVFLFRMKRRGVIELK